MADPAALHATQARPRICLALSGGGARGYAHIGVLKQLEALHVPIDCIAGTSMGAVIGGLYASGMSAAEIEGALAGIDLTDVAFDREARTNQPQEVRKDNLDYPVGFPLGFGSGGIRSAKGLIQGNQLLALLQEHTSRVAGDVDFDDLPVPFRAIATDIETGDRVVLHKGSLPQAIRASMAVPGLFAPVVLGRRTLVDGGIVDNLPVDVARQMGADIVIAVDIGTPLKHADELTSIASVTQQVLGVLVSQNVKRQKAQLGASDILLQPDLSGLAFADFADAARGIAAGAAAVAASREKIDALSLDSNGWSAYLTGRNGRAFLPDGVKIDRIEVVTNGRVPAARVRQVLRAKPGDVYDPVEIDRDLAKLTSASDFESVAHNLAGSEGERVLQVSANSKSWGPNFLLFGLGLSSNFSGDGAFSLRIGHRMPWITPSGLAWRNDVVLGSRDLMLKTELRQPLFSQDGIYVAPFATFKRNQLDVYDDDAPDGQPPAMKLRLQEMRVGLNAGLPLGKLGEIRASVERVKTSYSLLTAAPMFVIPLDGDETEVIQQTPGSSSQTVGRLEVEIDQLDDALFPRHGYYIDGYAEMALDQSEGSYNTAHLRTRWAASYGAHTVNAAFEAGGQFGNKDVNAYTFSLGGFQHLAAYAQDQFNGNYVMYGRLTYLAQLKHFNSAPIRDTFGGASAEVGNVWNGGASFGRGPWRSSASVFLGATTSLGPIYLGFAMAPGGVRNVYFQLGNQF
ncbi:patatin-like phospholipase family protein [Paraburkholderia sp. BCC1884]|uniref:patatin-like phospholipase family protein n=1 Tax=Paraburkholderia sp. BCC1884 TaxID=2562668 RepID=UPI001182C1EF|nr:patatin-like phospholipase family protein [Paraburkholderia sp. BCC1884]